MCRSEHVDVVVDTTGSVEFGAHVALEAFKHGKDVVLMNAEIDATIGPILQSYARKAGVILSACEGDEPGVQMNLVRWVRGLGLIPRVIGNIKGLQDPYRNPTTQKGFAERWGQNPAMVTSFADGSKISFEQTIVANATGFKVKSRGMSRGLEYRGDIMKIGFRDCVAPPLAGPVVEVCAVAKRDLRSGEVLDNSGMYMTYGEAVNVDEMSAGRYLPEGLVEGCKVKSNIAKDAVITYRDVELPAGRLADRLRAEQYRHFRGEIWLEEVISVLA